jgi:hypothetical protein
MQALNRKEVRTRSLNFWVQFGILVFSMLFVVYFFVWSSVKENERYIAKLYRHKQIENTQILLGYKVDSLYWYMGKLAYRQTSDEKFLVSYIRDQKQYIQQICYKDSTADFDGYKKVADKLDAQIALRDTIVTIEKQNGDLKNDFDNCLSRNTQMRRALSGAR